ncbi:AFG1 family ATPase [Alphaproteobacteria bacterium KMM 3653]|uniref:AFG1 family ATPase n=1 Tax=Harenicola maris TaxID=2841044 RepID=A0AAP2CQH3_9RHOB|nr:AFG1 family ATPase [Harenicola maris]
MSKSLTEKYESAVAAKELRPDAGQAEAVRLLEAMQGRIAAQAAPKKRGLRSWLDRSKPEPVRGLYLWGGVGRGKSMLMDMFFAAAEEPQKRRVHFHAFMQDIHSALHEARKTDVEDALVPVADAVLAEVRLLCLDEMQITDIADAMIVGRLFERFFAGGMAIVTTSNRPPKDLYKDGLNRAIFLPFIDLLEGGLEVHRIGSETDYRRDRLSGSQVYFSGNRREARAALDEIWQDLTGGQSEGLVLHVKGRQLKLPLFHNGVARAGFYDLCGQPLGPGDYLALAGAVRVLILDDIPALGRSNFNEAKRFVTLVDTLYEGRVRLIASAAAEPEMLYLEGEGSFEFERTASRLLEMQAADWGREGSD